MWSFYALFKGVSTQWVHEPLKSRPKIRISSFVVRSQIFVWVGEHEASLTHTKIWEGRTSMSEGAFYALENRGSVISGSVF
jgi:hypothetical protein